MAFDTRTALGVKKKGELNFSLSKVGFLKRVLWYLTNSNPMIHIPAWLAVWSVALGLIGTIIGVISIVY